MLLGMTIRNPYKIRSPETWDLIRAAYLGGGTARDVARRFDVTPAAIERRAGREKWTKKAWAAARAAVSAPPPEPGREEPGREEPDPAMTFPLAMGEAEAALRAGRGAEAMRLMQAAEHYLKMRHRLEDLERQRAVEQAKIDANLNPEAIWTQIADKAMVIAHGMVTRGGGPAFLARKIFAWRARHLGPAVAAEDFRRGWDGGWGRTYWNPDGTLQDPDGEGWTDEERRMFGG